MEEKKKENLNSVDEELEKEVLMVKAHIKSTLKTRMYVLLLFVFIVFVLNVIFKVPFYREIYLFLLLWILQNYIFSYIVNRKDDIEEIKNIYFSSSILVLLLLTFIIYYLGTVEWVGFVFYFITIIFNSFILSPRRGIIIAAIAAFLYVSMVVGEYLGIFFHKEPMFFTLRPGLYQDFWYVLVTGIIIPVIMFFVVATTSAIFSSALRKEKERSQRLYRLTKASSDIIINNMGDGLIVLDQDNKILRVNKMAEKLLALKKDIIGKPLSQATTLPVNWNAEEVVKTLTRGGTDSYKITVGEPPIRILESQQSNFTQAGGSLGTIIILRDVSPPWGVVYNSKTRQPESLAIVRVFDAETSRILQSKVTDKDGKFSFLIPPGKYYMTVRKEKFNFPSKIKGHYDGKTFEVKGKGMMVNFNVVIDPEK